MQVFVPDSVWGHFLPNWHKSQVGAFTCALAYHGPPRFIPQPLPGRHCLQLSDLAQRGLRW